MAGLKGVIGLVWFGDLFIGKCTINESEIIIKEEEFKNLVKISSSFKLTGDLAFAYERLKRKYFKEIELNIPKIEHFFPREDPNINWNKSQNKYRNTHYNQKCAKFHKGNYRRKN